MEEQMWLPSLSHFTNGNGWSGSEGVLRFEIEKPKDGLLTVVLWQDPFTRKYAEELDRAQFPITDGGRAEMMAWLMERTVQMNAAPPRSLQQLRDWRDKVKADCGGAPE